MANLASNESPDATGILDHGQIIDPIQRAMTPIVRISKHEKIKKHYFVFTFTTHFTIFCIRNFSVRQD